MEREPQGASTVSETLGSKCSYFHVSQGPIYRCPLLAIRLSAASSPRWQGLYLKTVVNCDAVKQSNKRTQPPQQRHVTPRVKDAQKTANAHAMLVFSMTRIHDVRHSAIMSSRHRVTNRYNPTQTYHLLSPCCLCCQFFDLVDNGKSPFEEHLQNACRLL